MRGLHPLIATAAGTGDVLGVRARGGNANTARGAASFLTEVFNRVRKAGASGTLTLRADAGFYSRSVVDTARRAKVAYSITVKMSKSLHSRIDDIADADWTPIPYWMEGGADAAECAYRPFGETKEVRLIVRRVKPSPGSQLSLLTEYSYHGFITDRAGPTMDLEADHRRHAEVELVIRDLKEGVGLNHMPSGSFGANAAWLALAAMAHNLARWTARLGGISTRILTTATLRRRFIAIPGHITSSGRRLSLHLATNWPWAQAFTNALERVRAIPTYVT